MSKARLIITAVVLEGRSQAQVARDYRVSQAWVSRLVARYRTEGDAAFEPRSRRPRTRPDATPTATVELVVALRRQLVSDGLDAGADTIGWHLQHHHGLKLSRSTIYRIVRRADLVTPEPRKKPRSSYIRFQAEQPNETWQADFTHWRLADGTDIEILTWLDDHYPARQRTTPPHRHRANPQQNPHHHAHQRLRRTHHSRRHRRNHPHTHHQPRTPLPRHRQSNRRTITPYGPHKNKKSKP